MQRPTREEILREPNARKACSLWFNAFVRDIHPPIEQLHSWYFKDELEVFFLVDLLEILPFYDLFLDPSQGIALTLRAAPLAHAQFAGYGGRTVGVLRARRRQSDA